MLKFLTLSIAAAAFSQALKEPTLHLGDSETMTNIGYISLGYDIYFGNPHNTRAGSDPGFRQAIFAQNYNTKQTTEDKRYSIPDGTNFIEDVGCRLDFESLTIKGDHAYTKDLEEDVSVQGTFKGLFEAKFSASSDYKEVRDMSSN